MATPYETINQYVLDDTGRPDLQDVINRRIQRALIKYHRMDTWKKDLIEQVYVFEPENTSAPTTVVTGGNALFMNSMQPPSQYIQQIDKRVLTGFRKVCYLRKWTTVNPWGSAIIDPETGIIGTTTNGDLEERSPDRMFDGYGYDVQDVFYESGDFLQIKSSTPLSQVYIGYFSDPIVSPIANIYSWIAKDYPDLIAAAVKTSIFSDIGKTDELKAAMQELGQQIAVLQTNNVVISMM